MTKAKKFKGIILICYIILCCCLVLSTGAYFKFNKIFTSSGDLPILNITKNISNTSNSVEISNVGNYSFISTKFSANDITLSIKFSSNGNNIDGFVRVQTLISWDNGLSNTKDGEKVCELIYNSDIFEIKDNGNYYLKNNQVLSPNTEIEFLSQIRFNQNFDDDYYGKSVTISILAEIHQTTNLPDNW